MADPARENIKAKLIEIVKPTIQQVAVDQVNDFVQRSPEMKQVRSLTNYNFQSYTMSSEHFVNLNIKDSFIWGKSTWGIDTVAKSRIINQGEYDPSNRTGVLYLNQFRPSS